MVINALILYFGYELLTGTLVLTRDHLHKPVPVPPSLFFWRDFK